MVKLEARRILIYGFGALACGVLALAILLRTPEAGRSVRDQPPEALTLDRAAVPAQRDRVRAFYSGHSLSHGLPPLIAQIAQSLGADFDYEQQGIMGSTIRERTLGPDPDSKVWTGYRRGLNRNGKDMDVQAELRTPRTLKEGERYDTLVVTERHDLPWAAFHERTPHYLRQLIDAFTLGDPDGADRTVWLYHSWLESGNVEPAQWIAYERDALRLWECVASSTNWRLAADGLPTRVRVLPGATALAELVERIVRGDVPDLPKDLQARLSLIFADDVHLAPAGAYFMAAVHFAALYGRSPEGAVIPSDVDPKLGGFMQKLAWEHVRAYAPRAQAAASRAMPACRAFAAQTMCPAYTALRGAMPMGLIARVKHLKSTMACARNYMNEGDRRNPFLDPLSEEHR